MVIYLSPLYAELSVVYVCGSRISRHRLSCCTSTECFTAMFGPVGIASRIAVCTGQTNITPCTSQVGRPGILQIQAPCKLTFIPHGFIISLFLINTLKCHYIHSLYILLFYECFHIDWLIA